MFEYKVEGDQICIGHTAGETMRLTVFEWNGEEFRNILIEPALRIEEGKYEWNEFYRMISDANLEGIRGSTLKELPKEDEYTRVFELVGFKPQFKDAYEDAFLQFGHHAKGVLPTEVVKEFLVESYKGEFGLPEGSSVTVDKTGSNYGNYWFDLMTEDDANRRLTFVGECESRWTEEEMDWGIFNSVKEDLKVHSVKAESEKWLLPDYGFGFVVVYRSDSILIYVRKCVFKMGEAEWIGW